MFDEKRIMEEESINPTQILPEKKVLWETVEKENAEYYTTKPLIYRSEQLTITKINGIIENHAETKCEYHVKRYVSEAKPLVAFLLTDNIVSIHPSELQDAINLVCEVENIKCNAIVEINKQTGKIEHIINIEDIQQRWLEYKKQIGSKYSFLKTNEAKVNLQTFINEVEKQMTEVAIIQSYGILPFFDLFFNKYLVDNTISLAPGSKTYYSQLFNTTPVELGITSKLLKETPETITIVKYAKLNAQSINVRDFERLYNERYKPMVGYKFSEYDFEHTTEITLNANESILESAAMRIIETVKNNVELIVDYKLRRIQ